METLNLVEKLKDCPKGTPLYSPLFGEVKLEKVDNCNITKYPIEVLTFGKDRINDPKGFTTEGKFWDDIFYNDECLLFPSKDCRDWSQFVPPTVPEPEPKPEPVFKPFDRVLVRVHNGTPWRVGLFDRKEDINEDRNYYVIGLPYYFSQCIPYEGNEHLKDTTETPKG